MHYARADDSSAYRWVKEPVGVNRMKFYALVDEQHSSVDRDSSQRTDGLIGAPGRAYLRCQRLLRMRAKCPLGQLVVEF